MFGTVVSSLTFLIDTFSIASDNIMWFAVWQFYYVVIMSVAIPTYNIADVVFYAEMSDCPSETVSDFVTLIVADLTGCTAFEQVKFRLRYCRCTLSTVRY